MWLNEGECRKMSADTVIRGGTVIDGTGSPGQVADVAVTDGRISDIGTGLSGRRVLDATGQVVSAGFHWTMQPKWAQTAENSWSFPSSSRYTAVFDKPWRIKAPLPREISSAKLTSPAVT